MFRWSTLRAGDGRVETVDCWPTIPEIIWEMACSSWEAPDNDWLSFVVDETSGLVVATAIFGPEGELLVTLTDGRRFCFPVPELYRQFQREWDESEAARHARQL
jgi:hypothetical protein